MATILLVDDLEFNRDILARRLKRHQFEVILAEGGHTCLSLANSKQPHLILLDMNLPDLSGWETASQLKRNPNCAHIPIIGVSAYADAATRQRALDAGCQDYETKPIDFQQLLKKIHAWLSPSTTN